jgi:hypothetical protein
VKINLNCGFLTGGFGFAKSSPQAPFISQLLKRKTLSQITGFIIVCTMMNLPGFRVSDGFNLCLARETLVGKTSEVFFFYKESCSRPELDRCVPTFSSFFEVSIFGPVFVLRISASIFGFRGW